MAREKKVQIPTVDYKNHYTNDELATMSEEFDARRAGQQAYQNTVVNGQDNGSALKPGGDTIGNGVLGTFKDAVDKAWYDFWGGSARFLANQIDPESRDGVLNSFADKMEELSAYNTEDPQQLTGAKWWANAVGNAIGSSAPTAIIFAAMSALGPAAGGLSALAGGVANGAKLANLISKGKTLGTFAQAAKAGANLVSKGAGAVASGDRALREAALIRKFWTSPFGKFAMADQLGNIPEAMSEAGNLVTQLRQDPENYSDEEIATAAWKSFGGNLAWLSTTDALQQHVLGKMMGKPVQNATAATVKDILTNNGINFTKEGMKQLGKQTGKVAAFNAFQEGLEEFGQGFIENKAAGQDFNVDDAIEAAKMGAAGGLFLGAGGNLMHSRLDKSKHFKLNGREYEISNPDSEGRVHTKIDGEEVSHKEFFSKFGGMVEGGLTARNFGDNGFVDARDIKTERDVDNYIADMGERLSYYGGAGTFQNADEIVSYIKEATIASGDSKVAVGRKLAEATNNGIRDIILRHNAKVKADNEEKVKEDIAANAKAQREEVQSAQDEKLGEMLRQQMGQNADGNVTIEKQEGAPTAEELNTLMNGSVNLEQNPQPNLASSGVVGQVATSLGLKTASDAANNILRDAVGSSDRTDRNRGNNIDVAINQTRPNLLGLANGINTHPQDFTTIDSVDEELGRGYRLFDANDIQGRERYDASIFSDDNFVNAYSHGTQRSWEHSSKAAQTQQELDDAMKTYKKRMAKLEKAGAGRLNGNEHLARKKAAEEFYKQKSEDLKNPDTANIKRVTALMEEAAKKGAKNLSISRANLLKSKKNQSPAVQKAIEDKYVELGGKTKNESKNNKPVQGSDTAPKPIEQKEDGDQGASKENKGSDDTEGKVKRDENTPRKMVGDNIRVALDIAEYHSEDVLKGLKKHRKDIKVNENVKVYNGGNEVSTNIKETADVKTIDALVSEFQKVCKDYNNMPAEERTDAVREKTLKRLWDLVSKMGDTNDKIRYAAKAAEISRHWQTAKQSVERIAEAVENLRNSKGSIDGLRKEISKVLGEDITNGTTNLTDEEKDNILASWKEKVKAVGIDMCSTPEEFLAKKADIIEDTKDSKLYKVTDIENSNGRIYIHYEENGVAKQDEITQDMGWTLPGSKVIYINKNTMDASTPIHEYVHVWAYVIKQNNPELWNKIKDVMKKTGMYNLVQEVGQYGKLSEDVVVEEALAFTTGYHWATIEKAINDKEKSALWLRAVKGFWNAVKELLGFHTNKKNAVDNDVFDLMQMPIASLLNKDTGVGISEREAVQQTADIAARLSFGEIKADEAYESVEKIKDNMVKAGLADPALITKLQKKMYAQLQTAQILSQEAEDITENYIDPIIDAFAKAESILATNTSTTLERFVPEKIYTENKTRFAGIKRADKVGWYSANNAFADLFKNGILNRRRLATYMGDAFDNVQNSPYFNKLWGVIASRAIDKFEAALNNHKQGEEFKKSSATHVKTDILNRMQLIKTQAKRTFDKGYMPPRNNRAAQKKASGSYVMPSSVIREKVGAEDFNKLFAEDITQEEFNEIFDKVEDKGDKPKLMSTRKQGSLATSKEHFSGVDVAVDTLLQVEEEYGDGNLDVADLMNSKITIKGSKFIEHTVRVPNLSTTYKISNAMRLYSRAIYRGATFIAQNPTATQEMVKEYIESDNFEYGDSVMEVALSLRNLPTISNLDNARLQDYALFLGNVIAKCEKHFSGVEMYLGDVEPTVREYLFGNVGTQKRDIIATIKGTTGGENFSFYGINNEPIGVVVDGNKFYPLEKQITFANGETITTSKVEKPRFGELANQSYNGYSLKQAIAPAWNGLSEEDKIQMLDDTVKAVANVLVFNDLNVDSRMFEKENFDLFAKKDTGAIDKLPKRIEECVKYIKTRRVEADNPLEQDQKQADLDRLIDALKRAKLLSEDNKKIKSGWGQSVDEVAQDFVIQLDDMIKTSLQKDGYIEGLVNALNDLREGNFAASDIDWNNEVYDRQEQEAADQDLQDTNDELRSIQEEDDAEEATYYEDYVEGQDDTEGEEEGTRSKSFRNDELESEQSDEEVVEKSIAKQEEVLPVEDDAKTSLVKSILDLEVAFMYRLTLTDKTPRLDAAKVIRGLLMKKTNEYIQTWSNAKEQGEQVRAEAANFEKRKAEIEKEISPQVLKAMHNAPNRREFRPSWFARLLAGRATGYTVDGTHVVFRGPQLLNDEVKAIDDRVKGVLEDVGIRVVQDNLSEKLAQTKIDNTVKEWADSLGDSEAVTKAKVLADVSENRKANRTSLINAIVQAQDNLMEFAISGENYYTKVYKNEDDSYSTEWRKTEPRLYSLAKYVYEKKTGKKVKVQERFLKNDAVAKIAHTYGCSGEVAKLAYNIALNEHLPVPYHLTGNKVNAKTLSQANRIAHSIYDKIPWNYAEQSEYYQEIEHLAMNNVEAFAATLLMNRTKRAETTANFAIKSVRARLNAIENKLVHANIKHDAFTTWALYLADIHDEFIWVSDKYLNAVRKDILQNNVRSIPALIERLSAARKQIIQEQEIVASTLDDYAKEAQNAAKNNPVNLAGIERTFDAIRELAKKYNISEKLINQNLDFLSTDSNNKNLTVRLQNALRRTRSIFKEKYDGQIYNLDKQIKFAYELSEKEKGDSRSASNNISPDKVDALIQEMRNVAKTKFGDNSLERLDNLRSKYKEDENAFTALTEEIFGVNIRNILTEQLGIYNQGEGPVSSNRDAGHNNQTHNERRGISTIMRYRLAGSISVPGRRTVVSGTQSSNQAGISGQGDIQPSSRLESPRGTETRTKDLVGGQRDYRWRKRNVNDTAGNRKGNEGQGTRVRPLEGSTNMGRERMGDAQNNRNLYAQVSREEGLEGTSHILSVLDYINGLYLADNKQRGRDSRLANDEYLSARKILVVTSSPEESQRWSQLAQQRYGNAINEYGNDFKGSGVATITFDALSKENAGDVVWDNVVIADPNFINNAEHYDKVSSLVGYIQDDGFDTYAELSRYVAEQGDKVLTTAMGKDYLNTMVELERYLKTVEDRVKSDKTVLDDAAYDNEVGQKLRQTLQNINKVEVSDKARKTIHSLFISHYLAKVKEGRKNAWNIKNALHTERIFVSMAEPIRETSETNNTVATPNGFRGEFSYLSNMHPSPIAIDGKTYNSVENYFQAMKSTDTNTQQKIAAASPVNARKLGRQVELREDWDNIKDAVMEKAVKAKFQQHPELTSKLNTVQGEIVEYNDWGDRYWGKDKVTQIGENKLGKILMSIRGEKTNDKVYTVAITGHRPQKLPEKSFRYDTSFVSAVIDRMQKEIEQLAKEHGKVRIVSGAALGIDQYWAIAAMRAKKNGANVILHMANVKGQDAKWGEGNKKTYAELLRQADEVHETPSTPGTHVKALDDRNKYMADTADEVIAWYDGSKGGTGNMVEYAKSIGKPLKVINPQEFNNNHDIAYQVVTPAATAQVKDSGQDKDVVFGSGKYKLTVREYRELDKQLKKLYKDREENIEDIKEARAQGDLSENAEYDAAKNKQGEIEAHISALKEKVENARVISPKRLEPSNKVPIGGRFVFHNLATDTLQLFELRQTNGEPVFRNLPNISEASRAVGETGNKKEDEKEDEVNVDGYVSLESPIGQAVARAKYGDLIVFEAPAGTQRGEIKMAYGVLENADDIQAWEDLKKRNAAMDKVVNNPSNYYERLPYEIPYHTPRFIKGMDDIVTLYTKIVKAQKALDDPKAKGTQQEKQEALATLQNKLVDLLNSVDKAERSLMLDRLANSLGVMAEKNVPRRMSTFNNNLDEWRKIAYNNTKGDNDNEQGVDNPEPSKRQGEAFELQDGRRTTSISLDGRHGGRGQRTHSTANETGGRPQDGLGYRVRLGGTNLVEDDVEQRVNHNREKNGLAPLKFKKKVTPKEFAEAMQLFISHKDHPMNKNMDAVDIKTEEDLNGSNLFLLEDINAGFAIKPDGDIVAVFKDFGTIPNRKIYKNLATDMVLIAKANGGLKMDCYGQQLANMYEAAGFVVVNSVEFNGDYTNSPFLLRTQPTVYTLMVNSDSAEESVRKFESGEAQFRVSEKLSHVKVYGKNEYDKAIQERDDLLYKKILSNSAPRRMSLGKSLDDIGDRAKKFVQHPVDTINEFLVGPADKDTDVKFLEDELADIRYKYEREVRGIKNEHDRQFITVPIFETNPETGRKTKVGIKEYERPLYTKLKAAEAKHEKALSERMPSFSFFRSVHNLAKENPLIKRFYDIFINAGKKQEQLRNRVANNWNEILELLETQEQIDLFRDIVIQGSINGVYYTRAELVEAGIDTDVIEAVQKMRLMNDYLWAIQNRAHRGLIPGKNMFNRVRIGIYGFDSERNEPDMYDYIEGQNGVDVDRRLKKSVLQTIVEDKFNEDVLITLFKASDNTYYKTREEAENHNKSNGMDEATAKNGVSIVDLSPRDFNKKSAVVQSQTTGELTVKLRAVEPNGVISTSVTTTIKLQPNEDILISYNKPQVHHGHSESMIVGSEEWENFKNDPHNYIYGVHDANGNISESDLRIIYRDMYNPETGIFGPTPVYSITYDYVKGDFPYRKGYLPHFFGGYGVYAIAAEQNEDGSFRERVIKLASDDYLQPAIEKAKNIKKNGAVFVDKKFNDKGVDVSVTRFLGPNGKLGNKKKQDGTVGIIEVFVKPQDFSMQNDKNLAECNLDEWQFRKTVEAASQISGGDFDTIQQQLKPILQSKRFHHRFNSHEYEQTGDWGWNMDIFDIMPKYINQATRYAAMEPAKFEAISEFEGAFGEGSFNTEAPVTAPLQRWLKRYIRYNNGTPMELERKLNQFISDSEWLSKFCTKWLNASYKDRVPLLIGTKINSIVAPAMLGCFSISSALVNLSQLKNAYVKIGYKGLEKGILAVKYMKEQQFKIHNLEKSIKDKRKEYNKLLREYNNLKLSIKQYEGTLVTVASLGNLQEWKNKLPKVQKELEAIREAIQPQLDEIAKLKSDKQYLDYLRILHETGTDTRIGLASPSAFTKGWTAKKKLQGKKLDWESVQYYLRKASDKGMMFFQGTEEFTRNVATLGAYLQARETPEIMGRPDFYRKAAIDFAKNVDIFANFDYGSADAPGLFSMFSGTGFGEVALLFQKYPIKEGEIMMQALPMFGKNNMTTTEKIRYWSTYMMLCGMFAFPFFDWFENLINEISGVRIFSKAKARILETFGENPFTYAVCYGIPGAFGTDISHRISLANMAPDHDSLWGYLTGVPGSAALNVANSLCSGDFIGAVKAYAPALGHATEAFYGARYDRKHRMAYRYSDGERAFKAFGFRPTGESVQRDLLTEERNQTNRKLIERQSLKIQLAKKYSAGDQITEDDRQAMRTLKLKWKDVLEEYKRQLHTKMELQKKK